MSEDPLDRERNHWWKAKKWAYFNLNRLYIRYWCPHSNPPGPSADCEPDTATLRLLPSRRAIR
jgi:hypothetical protein